MLNLLYPEVQQAHKVKSKATSVPSCPDQLWGPPSLLSNGDWNPLPQG